MFNKQHAVLYRLKQQHFNTNIRQASLASPPDDECSQRKSHREKERHGDKKQLIRFQNSCGEKPYTSEDTADAY